MGHRLSKITTRTGDAGETGLGDGTRVSKDNARIRALGDLDELNSVIGMVLAEDVPEAMREALVHVQHDLFDLGGEAQLAGTCEQAVRLASNYAYDAILLDLLMPGIGGQAVLAEIRQATPNAGTPVIIVSVVDDRMTIDACTAAGANAYHVKPV